MSFHAARQTEIGLSLCLGDPRGSHDRPQHDGEQDDHYHAAHKLGGNKLPPD
jgi:hypothetical protein